MSFSSQILEPFAVSQRQISIIILEVSFRKLKASYFFKIQFQEFYVDVCILLRKILLGFLVHCSQYV